MRVVVVGAGVSGLSCAIRMLEAGAEVTIVTAGDSRGTASAVAGAMLGPVFGSAGERSLEWERESDRVFRALAGEPSTGVRIVRGRLLSSPALGPDLPPWAESIPGFRACEPEELPPSFVAGMWAELPFADMPTYLSWLVSRVGELGGRLEQRMVASLSDAAHCIEPAADIVVNCAGLGSRQLAGDSSVQPVWGQHVIVDSPDVDEFVFEGGATGDCVSIMPQPRGVLLGGIRRADRNDLVPDRKLVAETIQRSATVFPALAEARVLTVEVGLRPGRPEVRLEGEQLGDLTVVHNYGHGGNGVFWSWGCAHEVAQLCS